MKPLMPSKIFVTFSFLWLCFFSNAQHIVVLDENTEKPIVNAVLNQNGTLYSLDKNGSISVETLHKDEPIQISAPGYASQSILISEEDGPLIVYLSNDAIYLGTIVLSANKRAQKSLETPLKIGSVSEQEINFLQPQTAADLLEQTGQVFVQKSQQGGGSPMIRGFAANRVLITVDGVRMNNAIFRGGNLQNVISIPPSGLEKVEFIYGPGSLIYGSDAIGGVMSFFTKQHKFLHQKEIYLEGNTSVRYSSANEEKAFNTNLNLSNEKWSSITSFAFNSFGNMKMGSHGPDEYLDLFYVNDKDEIIQNPNPKVQRPTGYDSYHFMQKIGFKAHENLSFGYTFLYNATSNIPRYDRLYLTNDDGAPRSSRWDYGPQKWTFNKFSLSHEAQGFYNHMDLALSHQFFEESRITRSFQSFRETTRTEKVNVLGVNVDFEKNFSDKNKTYYGVELILNDIGSYGEVINIQSGAVNPASTRYPNASKWNSYAAYFSHEYKPHEKWILSAGIRYNYIYTFSPFNSDFFDFPFQSAETETAAFNGNLGVVYNPNKKSALSFLFSTGFRAPNIDDIGKVFDSEPGSVVVPNPNLVFEYAYNFELNYNQIIGQKLRMNFTSYYSHLVDALVRRDYSFNGSNTLIYDGIPSQVQAIQNAAFAYVYGFEGMVNFKLSKRWELNHGFSYQKGYEEQENGTLTPLRHAAPFFAHLRVLFTTKKWELTSQLRYNGAIDYEDLAQIERNKPELYAKDFNGNPYSPSWYTFNFKGNYWLNGFTSVYFGCDNITDQRYRTYSSGIAAPGRNWMLGMQVNF